jgi:tetratricopeptide (TPR) repeat protein
MVESKRFDYSGRQLGNYRILSRLASGSFGDVYLAEHRLLPRTVAIKFLHTDLSASDSQYRSFLQEAQLLEALKHPHILPLYDAGFGLEDFPPHLIAAYAPGGSLRDYLRRQPGGLPLEEALTILEQVGSALQHAHEQQKPVVHRDLKPENILFDGKGNALLADFGIAVVLDAAVSQRVSIVGTLPYMAPEQFAGHVLPASDQYALGCLAYELLTGKRPFSVERSSWIAWAVQHREVLPPPPSAICPELPPHIELAVLKALMKEPRLRHSDIASFLDALRTAPHRPADYEHLKRERLQQARRAVQERQYDRALSLYDLLARVDPDEPLPLVEKGHLLLAMDQLAEARAAYEQALRLAPGHSDALQGLARVAQAESKRMTPVQPPAVVQPSPAASVQQPPAPVQAPPAVAQPPPAVPVQQPPAASVQAPPAVVQPSPAVGQPAPAASVQQPPAAAPGRPTTASIDERARTRALALKTQAERWLREQRYAEAVQAYREAERSDPTLRLDWCAIGEACWSQGRYQEALIAYSEAVRQNPQDGAAHLGRAGALYQLGRSREALEAYEAAIAVDPGNAAAHYGQGLIFMEREQYGRALQAYERALAPRPDFVAAHCARGQALYQKRAYQEALAAYETALRYDATCVEALYGKAETLLQLKRKTAAHVAYEQALHAEEQSGQVSLRRGDALFILGRYQEALAVYEQLLREQPDEADLYERCSNALQKLGRSEEAREAYKEASRLRGFV